MGWGVSPSRAAGLCSRGHCIPDAALPTKVDEMTVSRVLVAVFSY